MSVGAINIALGATIGSFVSGINQMRQSVGQLASDINGKLVTSYANADRQQRVFERGLGRLGNGLQDMGGKLSSYVTAPIIGVGVAAFKTYADINALQLGLENITGSSQGAKARFEELKEVAKLPGLGLEEAVQGDVRLQAVGFSAKTSKDALLQFGNALALTGGGKFELNSVITQLSQMGSKSKVLAEDLKPILSASPAVAKAIRGMFGTVDSEAISGQLTKTGKGPGEFIKDLITNLSLLERVKGGPKNAIENFGDAVKLSAFTLGEAADKAFDLTGIFNKIGDTIGGLAQRFSELPAGIQKAILGTVGFATAMGPVLLGIGSVIKLLPVLKLGFAALGGPIAIAAAVIIGAVALIVANWDKLKVYWESLKKVLVDSGIWETLKGLITSSIEAVTAVIQTGVKFIIAVWDSLKGYLIPAAKFIFGTIGEVFKFGAGVITGIFKVLTGVLTGDWSKLKEGLQNITVSIWNGIIGLTSNSIIYVGSLFAAFVEQFGAKDFASSIRKGLDGVSASADKMKVSLQGAQKATPDAVTLPEVTVLGKRVAKPDDFGGGGTGTGKKAKTYSEQLEAELKAAERRIKDFQAKNPGIQIPMALSYEKGRLQDLLKINDKTDLPTTAEIGPIKSAGQRYWKAVAEGWMTPMQRQFESIKTDIPRMMDSVRASIEASMDRQRLKGDFNVVDAAKEKFGRLADLKREVNRSIEGGFVGRDMVDGMGFGAIDEAIEKGNMSLSDLVGFSESFQAVLQSFSEGVRATSVEIGASIFEALGAAIGGGENVFESLLKNIAGMISSFLVSTGKMLIKAGSFMLASTITAPLGIKNIAIGGLMIAGAGVIGAMVAKGGASKLPKFANGNVAYKPTVAMFGEYAGASYNPEITTPEKKMREVFRTEMANYGGGGSGELKAILRGEDLLLLTERALKSRNERR